MHPNNDADAHIDPAGLIQRCYNASDGVDTPSRQGGFKPLADAVTEGGCIAE